MIRTARASVLPLVAAALFIGQAPSVLACTACFGQSNDRLAQGMNMGIFALLLVIGCVLGGVASFFVFVARRSAAETPAEPAPAEPLILE